MERGADEERQECSIWILITHIPGINPLGEIYGVAIRHLGFIRITLAFFRIFVFNGSGL
jgi:hypothetical protein